MPDDPEAATSRPPRRPGPIGGDMAAIVHGLAARARLPALLRRYDRVTVLGFFAGINGVISIGLMAFAALVTDAPFVFPSLGPTAFLLFYTPLAVTACPRNTLCGHAIGAAVQGSLALRDWTCRLGWTNSYCTLPAAPGPADRRPFDIPA